MRHAEKEAVKQLKFDKSFWVELYQVLKTYLYTEKLKSLLFLLLIVLCTVGMVRSQVALNEFNKDFFNALTAYNTKAAITQVWHLIIIALVLMFATAYSNYFTGLLSIHWRRLATHRYVGKWLSDRKYYHLKIANDKVDNPDQRISSDLEQFPSETLFFFTSLFNSVLTMFAFGFTLWQSSVPMQLGHYTLRIPGFFFLAAVFYSVAGTLLTGLIGRKLAVLNYDQQKFNANFRFRLIKLQEASEEIALYQGEAAEHSQIGRNFLKVITNAISLNKLKKRLIFFSNGFSTSALAFSVLLPAPFYLNKQIDMGTLMLVGGGFTYIVSSFSIFVQVFQSLAEWRANIHRIAEFNKHLNEEALPINIEIKTHDKPHLEVHDLDLCLAPGQKLLVAANLSLEPAKCYLIRGKTGIGKSTLFKAIAGLWPHGRGTVLLPSDANIFFLPQKPYLFTDTLMANLCYPSKALYSPEALAEALHLVGLSHLQDALSIVSNYERMLSLGQQQLLGFARIFLLKPNVLFLDEATSALDEPIEAYLYTTLRQLLPNAIILSIAHRSSLDKFHDEIIRFEDLSLIRVPSSYNLRPQELSYTPS